MKNEIYYHEDDYCQVEMLPSESLTWCTAQMDQIEESSVKNWSGNGWDEMFIREPEPIKIAQRNIVILQAVKDLCPPLDFYDKVFTGYSSYREVSKQTVAAISDIDSRVFISSDGDVISKIWLQINDNFGDLKCRNALIEFMASHRLFIVDWGFGTLIGPNESDFDKYAMRFK